MMKSINPPMVIAIASISGGGKTTIVKQLSQQLPNSKALYFDDYDLEGPEDILEWVDRGANSNEWNLTPLIKDLKLLIEASPDYILLDFPFAYQHSRTKAIIDFTVFIDTPLDIALARRINRDFSECSTKEIMDYIAHYANHGRRGYLEMLSTVKPDCDWVIDGLLPASDIADLIALHAERDSL